MHRAHRRAALGDGRGAEQDRAAQAEGAGAFEEGQHDRRRVRVADGWDEVDAVGAGEGVVVGGGVVPVEAGRFRAGECDAPAAGRADAVAGGEELCGGTAAGGAGGADDEDGADGGHRVLPVKSTPGSCTASGFQ
ncbi:hypothetical protein GCM10010294_46930 [Streptomyces griseoloalbus]|nr:hypothetical protein GCM10010294_46930 [Streptomyces griseoloalbus]